MRKGNSEHVPAELRDELRELEQATGRPDATDLATIPEAHDWSQGMRRRFRSSFREVEHMQSISAEDRWSECNTRFEHVLDVMEDAKPLLAAPQGVMRRHAERMWKVLDEISAALERGGHKRPSSSSN